MKVAGQIKRLSIDTFFYGLGSTLQRFIAFLLFPIYTRVLTQDDFGAQDLIFTAFTIAFFLLILGLDNGASRDYYDANTPDERRRILSTWLWFDLAISIPVCTVLIVLAPQICDLLFSSAALAPLFQLAMASVPVAIAAKVTLIALRLTFQARRFSIVTAAGVLIQAVLTIVLVVVARLGVRGIFIAYLAGNAIQLALGLALTYRHFGPSLSLSWLKSMLAYGLPTVPASVSIWIMNSSNRYYLARLGTLSDIGLLSVGVRISTVVTFVITAFQTAWAPFAFSLSKDEDLARRTYSKVLTYFTLVTMATAAGLGIFARELVLILATPAYEASAPLVAVLCYSAIAWGAADIVGIGFGIAKKSYHVTVATVAGALVNIGFNILLIPAWGILGAAVATLIGNVLVLAYNYTMGQRYFRVKYEHRKLFSLTTATTLALAVSLLLDRAAPAWHPSLLIFKMLIYAMFAASLFAMRVIGRAEVDIARNSLAARFARLGAK